MEWPESSFKWPEWVGDIFPALFIFHRKNKPKPRKGAIIKMHGRQVLERKEATKAVRNQNNYWVYAVVLNGPDDAGTIFRNFKHKGFGELAGVCFATNEEVESLKGQYRYVFRKYKTFTELYNCRRVPADREQEWKELCDRMEQLFPPQVTGQLQLL